MTMASKCTIGPSLPAGAAFGRECGAPFDERAGRSCPNGHSIRSGDTYCWSCGAAIPVDAWVDATAWFQCQSRRLDAELVGPIRTPGRANSRVEESRQH